ncbi:MAG: hypothetical protein FRX49_13136 [Trebouxia sp. A1-2]|nr:MAG: hypothetical protein FRX49_13136 [Trebouxia sp. A1-2]
MPYTINTQPANSDHRNACTPEMLWDAPAALSEPPQWLGPGGRGEGLGHEHGQRPPQQDSPICMHYLRHWSLKLARVRMRHGERVAGVGTRGVWSNHVMLENAHGIFAVSGSPKMLEVAKHDMRRPAAGPVPRLVGVGTTNGTAQHSTARHGAARHGRAGQGRAGHSRARHGTARHSTAQHSTARHGTARHARHSTAQPSASTAQPSAAQRSAARTAQHAQHSTAQHSTAQHSTVQRSHLTRPDFLQSEANFSHVSAAAGSPLHRVRALLNPITSSSSVSCCTLTMSP